MDQNGGYELEQIEEKGRMKNDINILVRYKLAGYSYILVFIYISEHTGSIVESIGN